MTESLLATLIGLYLALTLPPVVTAWRRGRPDGEIRKAFLYSVLLGWTVIGYLAGWIIALESDAPAFRIEGRIDAFGHRDGVKDEERGSLRSDIYARQNGRGVKKWSF
ncbi:superinfection immunity protein [Sulfuricystis multivorans]|uniref:superinfection immunity protein n=1 Tax=Sulfuricystis multivorans TaxID=2211108 RepID=UPI000F8312FD|nr:superinfection immunity protein [Sulfuricystis multivorans]